MELEEMEKFETEIYYKINEIETQLNETHDKILLKEIVNFCNEYEVLDYEISIDMLKEALSLYIDKKEREKFFGKDIDVPTKTPRWIPISERLPEVAQRVIFCMKNGGLYIGTLHTFENDLKITLEPIGIVYVYSLDNVTAWMPLPKPHKESEV